MLNEEKIKEMAMRDSVCFNQLCGALHGNFVAIYILDTILKERKDGDEILEKALEYAEVEVEKLKKTFIENYKKVNKSELELMDLFKF